MGRSNNEGSHLRVEKTFYPNGNLESEVSYDGESIVGTSKSWYDNGVLQSSVNMKNSLMHGTRRIWSRDDKLLDESDFFMGTGVFRTFHDDGTISGEMSMNASVPHGRQRCWDEEGNLIVERYFVSGKRVSDKTYFKSCMTDESLPAYDPYESEVQTAITQATDFQPKAEDFPDRRNAFEWLAEASTEVERTLGELPDRTASVELLREYTTRGALSVLVVNRTIEKDRTENAGELLVELPENCDKRKLIIELCNEQNASLGFRPANDVDQRWVHVALD